jgi:hypothetical protein
MWSGGDDQAAEVQSQLGQQSQQTPTDAQTSERAPLATASNLPTATPTVAPSIAPSELPSGIQQSDAPSATDLPAGAPVAAAGSSVTRSGWHSGASGIGVPDGSLGTWRGSPLQIGGTFSDTTADVQTNLDSMKEFDGFTADLDIAVGGLAEGSNETWAEAAKGAYVARWTQAVQRLKTLRAGATGTTYVRFAHEFNGDWFTWKVNSGNVADFKTAWRLFHDVLKKEFPQAQLVFCANSDSHADIGVPTMWPGDDVVDVVGTDFYAGWQPSDPAGWQQHLGDTEPGQSPRGLGSWLAFAKAHGKPLALPEWGLNPGNGSLDDPAYIQDMHDFMAANAAGPGGDNAGKVLYDVYFNCPNGGDSRWEINDAANPNAAQTYRSLRWGVSDGPASPARTTPTQATAGPDSIGQGSVGQGSVGQGSVDPAPAAAQSGLVPVVPGAILLPAAVAAPQPIAPGLSTAPAQAAAPSIGVTIPTQSAAPSATTSSPPQVRSSGS